MEFVGFGAIAIALLAYGEVTSMSKKMKKLESKIEKLEKAIEIKQENLSN